MANLEQTIQRYLLGEMTEVEREALEQEYFNDRQLFDQMVQIENELVDKYARGLLPPTMRDHFEKHYLAHPKRRERARFAEALASKLDTVVAAPRTAESGWDRFLISMRGPKLALAISVAVLMAAVAAWSLIETRRLRQELTRTEAERATREQRERELQDQLSSERLRADQLSGELERLRAEEQASASSTSKVPPSFATLILSIGGTRGANAGPPAVLIIPSGTEQVRLQLNLRENDYSSYGAILQPAGGPEIFARRRLIPRATRSGLSLTLVIPAGRFAFGDYILTLRGVSKSGEVEDVSKSLFRVERK